MGKGKAEVGESVLFEKGPVGFRSFPILDGTWERADGQGEASPGGCPPPHTALGPAEPSSRSHHAAAFATPLDTVPKGHRTALEGVELVLGGREGAEKKKPLVFL